MSHAISLAAKPVADLGRDELRFLQMQEMTDTVDDLGDGSAGRQVGGEVAEQFSADRPVTSAV
jgi:hypothetical protein